VLVFTLLLLGASLLSGVLGAITGLGGGMIIIPLLVLIFKIDIQYAMGASLVAVIATSCGAAAAHARDGYANLRVGIFLELTATACALAGAHLVAFLPGRCLQFMFALTLLYSTWLNLRDAAKPKTGPGHVGAAHRLGLEGDYPGPDGEPVHYCAQNVSAGLGVMSVAGFLSGLLGIGSGALKVLAMDHFMRLPFKVSTATSNFMVGVTAAASAGVYLQRGYIDPALTMPVLLGTLAGSMAGAQLLPRLPVAMLRKIFTGVLGLLGVQMLFKCFGYEF